MSEEYTPTVDEVRGHYAGGLNDNDVWEHSREREKEFDRWLARHDREIARDAVRMALEALIVRVSQLEAAWDRKSGARAEGMSHAAGKICVLIAEQIDDIRIKEKK